MSDKEFSKEDWMEEQDVIQTGDWENFRGKPKQEFCDIILKDGTEVGPCWARGKDFIDVTSEEGVGMPYSNVVKVKYYEPSDSFIIAHDDDSDDDVEDLQSDDDEEEDDEEEYGDYE